MQPLAYVALLQEQPDGGWLVRFPDVPEAITHGETVEAARLAAHDALAAALEGYLELGRPFPSRDELEGPRLKAGVVRFDVSVEPALAARALLARGMADAGVSGRGLAQLLGRDEKVVRRILAGQASLDLTLEALRAVGVRPALAA